MGAVLRRPVSNDRGVVMLQIGVHTRRPCWRPTLKTIRWSMKLVLKTSVNPTSVWRPFSKLAMMTPFPPVPSGFVPGAEADGRCSSLLFVGGSRGLDCFYQTHVGSCLLKVGTVVIFLLLRVPSVICRCTAGI